MQAGLALLITWPGETTLQRIVARDLFRALVKRRDAAAQLAGIEAWRQLTGALDDVCFAVLSSCIHDEAQAQVRRCGCELCHTWHTAANVLNPHSCMVGINTEDDNV